MTKFILTGALFWTGCFENTGTTHLKDTGTEAAASLSRSSDSLDRTLTSMNQMVKDMERMNKNLDAIFKAVTDCKTTPECEALKVSLYKKHLEEKSNERTE